MVDTAVHLFCRPEIPFTVKQHTTGGKTILEVEVIKGDKRPYQAKDENGKWLTYFRHHDQNLVANRVLLQVWRKEEKRSGVMVKFGKAENSLMDYLAKNGSITLSRFRKIAGIPALTRPNRYLANLIIFKVLIMNSSEKGFSYELNPAEITNSDHTGPDEDFLLNSLLSYYSRYFILIKYYPIINVGKVLLDVTALAKAGDKTAIIFKEIRYTYGQVELHLKFPCETSYGKWYQTR